MKQQLDNTIAKKEEEIKQIYASKGSELNSTVQDQMEKLQSQLQDQGAKTQEISEALEAEKKHSDELQKMLNVEKDKCLNKLDTSFSKTTPIVNIPKPRALPPLPYTPLLPKYNVTREIEEEPVSQSFKTQPSLGTQPQPSNQVDSNEIDNYKL